jgi:hypothetical protein
VVSRPPIGHLISGRPTTDRAEGGTTTPEAFGSGLGHPRRRFGVVAAHPRGTPGVVQQPPTPFVASRPLQWEVGQPHVG